MPLGGTITVLASGSTSPWFTLDAYGGPVTMNFHTIGGATTKGRVEFTMYSPAVLGTAGVVTTAAVTALVAFSSVSAANTAAASAATSTYAYLPGLAIRVVCVSAGTDGVDGVRCIWTQAWA